MVLTSTCTPVVGCSAVIRVCQRVDIELHARGHIQYGLARSRLIFSLVCLIILLLDIYVYNCAQ